MKGLKNQTSLVWTLFYTIFITLHCLEQFSFLHDNIPDNFFKPFVTVILPISVIEKFFELFMFITIATDYIKRTGVIDNNKFCWIFVMANFLRVILWSLSHPVLLALLLFYDFGCDGVKTDCYERRVVAALMISNASYLNLIQLIHNL